MKKTGLIFLIFCASAHIFHAQAQPDGAELIIEFSKRMQTYQTISADITFTLENLQEGFTDSHEGEFLLKGKKYFLNLMGMEVFFNGTTKWQFIPDANEVTISSALPDEEASFLDDPTLIFRDYEENFKKRFMGERQERGIALYEVDLYPEDLSVPYSIIKITFVKNTYEPKSVRYQGKDGINYIIDIKNFKSNIPANDQKFNFDVSKHRGIEVIDLR